MTAIVECVPNFSEGRNLAVIAALEQAIANYPVWLLDSEHDADHHRCVLTVAGAPEAVSSAILAAVRVAVEQISLEEHRGVHPRIGAADIVPFVPLHGMTLDDAVALARDFARTAAETLDVPVYLVDAAALRPDRGALPNVRRGGYEWLKEAIQRDPDLRPDFGPSRIGPAGAIMVSARRPLIAFNYMLSTDAVEVAQAIAGAIRARDGGLPAVRSLGFLVAGQAQVSCNLLDFRQTSLAALTLGVRREAARHGVEVIGAELIGLAPQEALLGAAAELLGLPLQAAGASIEARLGAAAGDYRPIDHG